MLRAPTLPPATAEQSTVRTTDIDTPYWYGREEDGVLVPGTDPTHPPEPLGGEPRAPRRRYHTGQK